MQRTCLFGTYFFVLVGQHPTHAFLARAPRTAVAGRVRRCSSRIFPRLAATPPSNRGSSNGGGTAAAAEDGASGRASFGEDAARMTRAPLRITPNIQPQDERRPKTDTMGDLAVKRAFMTDASFDMFALVWAEFTDWSRRTVSRNVAGVPFQFDIRQWCSSARKWWLRMVEMDLQAKPDFFRLYEQGMQERDAWSNQAVKVDARVEDEWDSIYVECQDCEDSGGGGGTQSARGRPSAAGAGAAAAAEGLTMMKNGVARTTAAYFSTPSPATRAGGGSARDRDFPPRFSLSQDLDFDAIFAGEEEEEEEMEGKDDEDGDGDGDDGEEGVTDGEIIDCAIRGKWYFKDNDDQPHFSPQ